MHQNTDKLFLEHYVTIVHVSPWGVIQSLTLVTLHAKLDSTVWCRVANKFAVFCFVFCFYNKLKQFFFFWWTNVSSLLNHVSNHMNSVSNLKMYGQILVNIAHRRKMKKIYFPWNWQNNPLYGPYLPRYGCCGDFEFRDTNQSSSCFLEMFWLD